MDNLRLFAYTVALEKLCLSSGDGHSSVRCYIPAAAGVVPFAIAQEDEALLGEEEDYLTDGTVSIL